MINWCNQHKRSKPLKTGLMITSVDVASTSEFSGNASQFSKEYIIIDQDSNHYIISDEKLSWSKSSYRAVLAT